MVTILMALTAGEAILTTAMQLGVMAGVITTTSTTSTMVAHLVGEETTGEVMLGVDPTLETLTSMTVMGLTMVLEEEVAQLVLLKESRLHQD